MLGRDGVLSEIEKNSEFLFLKLVNLPKRMMSGVCTRTSATQL